MGLGANAFTSSADRADCRRRAHREDRDPDSFMDTARIASAYAPRALTVAIAVLATPCRCAVASEPTVAPADLPRIATIDPRFQSFNIEMVEVTGGPFWKPYADDSAKSQDKAPSTAPARANLFSNRSPIDLTSPLLRKFAAALSPAYLRVSGK